MAPPNYAVNAAVVDVRRDTPGPGDKFLIDTNILYWVTYTKASTAGRPPKARKVTSYSSYLERAVTAGSSMYVCGLSLAELAHRIEAVEYELFVRARGGSTLKKEFRHNFPKERREVAAEISAAWGQVKSLAKVAAFMLNDRTVDQALASLHTQALDGYDAFLKGNMDMASVRELVTDDGDFLTVPGITVFTCNPSALDAARQQGRLQER